MPTLYVLPYTQTLYTPHPNILHPTSYTQTFCKPHFTTHTHFTPKYFATHTLHPNTLHPTPYTQTLYISCLTPKHCTLHNPHHTPYTQSLHTPYFTPKRFTSHILPPNTVHLTPKQTHYTPRPSTSHPTLTSSPFLRRTPRLRGSTLSPSHDMKVRAACLPQVVR